MAENQLPAGWANAETLQGIDHTEKSELVGVPFRLFNVSFRTNASGNHLAEVDGERADGSTFRFTDFSSTGVRQQLMDYLVLSKNIEPTDGELFEIDLVFIRGLRISNFERMDPRSGKLQKVATFYLTLSGVPSKTESDKAHKGATRTVVKK